MNDARAAHVKRIVVTTASSMVCMAVLSTQLTRYSENSRVHK